MKLYVFRAGTVRTDKVYIVAGSPSQPYNVPVPYYLIEHEKGYILYDTGFNYATVQDTEKALPGPIFAAYNPEVPEEGFVLNTLKQAGVSPEEIKYVVCSHLHFDHCGGIGLFPNATYVVQKEELNYAYAPDPFMKLVYFREDFDRDVNWLLLDGWNDHKYDLFGDGKLIIYFTPGHCPGHQSLMVNLENSGQIMLTGDACYTAENMNDNKLSGLACDNSAYVSGLSMFRDMHKRGVNVMIGHDPEAWDDLKKFPEYYD